MKSAVLRSPLWIAIVIVHVDIESLRDWSASMLSLDWSWSLEGRDYFPEVGSATEAPQMIQEQVGLSWETKHTPKDHGKRGPQSWWSSCEMKSDF